MEGIIFDIMIAIGKKRLNDTVLLSTQNTCKKISIIRWHPRFLASTCPWSQGSKSNTLLSNFLTASYFDEGCSYVVQ